MKDIPNNWLVLLLVLAGIGAAATLPSNNLTVTTSILAIAATAFQPQSKEQGKDGTPKNRLGQEKKDDGKQL